MKHLLSALQPAKEWEEAYPIGNGSLGAMIMGNVREEQIFLNEDSIWYGGEKDCHNTDTIHFIDEIRNLLFEEKLEKASRLAKHAMTSTPKYINPYHPLGVMNFSFEGLEGDLSDYKRSLDLDEAISKVDYKHKGIWHTREFFSSYIDQVMAMKFTAKGEEKLSFSVHLSRRPFDVYTARVDESTLVMKGQSGPEGVKFCTFLSGKVWGGSIQVIGDFLCIEGAKEVELYLTVGTSFKEKEYEKQALGRNRKAREKGFNKLKKNHIEDYQSIYKKNQLCLSEQEECLTTIELIERAKKGERTGELAELFYTYGKYLLIGSSRKGTLPCNLQGIWNNSFTPAWECNYTININTQMNYWPALVCNLEACQEPLITFIKRLCQNGKETARRLYGCKGSVAHHTTNIWAQTTPGGVFAASPFWPMGLAWLSLHLSEYYHYTQDTDFLMDTCLPILEEVGDFYQDYLVKTPEGEWVSGPSLSPENEYRAESGEVSALCMGPSMDTQIIRQVLQEYITLSKLLGLNEEKCKEFQEILKALPPIRIGKYGQIMEWYKDYEEVELGHRHISHLFGLHPGNQITQEYTPKLFEAAKKTLERRLENGGGHTSWSMAWIINFYARLQEGEEAYGKLLTLMTKQTRCNLFTVHPPFQIDGNLGGCAGIAEMLVQSHEGFVRLLPALPKAWSKGYAKGFCVRGGTQIDFEWEEGQIKKVSLCAVKDTTCILNIPSLKEPLQVALKKGEWVSYILILGQDGKAENQMIKVKL